MSLFRRRRPGRHADDRHVFVEEVVVDSDDDDDEEPEDAIESFIDGLVDADANEGRIGPYDEEDAPDDELVRVDLGSLRVPVEPGMELRLFPDNGLLELSAASSSVRLRACAAPRSAGIWDEIRAERIADIGRQGGRCEECPGDYGLEVRARVRTEHGPTDIRVVGVDGPRWFLEAEFHGAAATDPAAAGSLLTCLRGLVVVRGAEPRPVREVLPLHPPRDAEAAEEDGAADNGPKKRPDRGRSRRP